MKVLIISDGHGDTKQLDRLEAVAATADMVLFGGDFAEFGKPETGLPFLERLAALHDRVFSVSGNCDEPDFRDTLESFDISIEGSLSYFSGLMLSGSGGASKFTGVTPNERTDEDLVSDLHLVAESVPGDLAADETGWNNLVLIAHNPPKDTLLDLAGSAFHVGSPLLRAFIEKYKPLLVVSGHIHESPAIDALGKTVLVNPGPLSEGKYAVAEITGGGKIPFSVSSIQLFSL
jgi:Icc-related predicted phosphoesterase